MNLDIELKLKEVRSYVEHKHATQMYGDFHYIYHLDMVADTLKSILDTRISLGHQITESTYLNLLISAYCHDIMEDQGVTVKQLKEKYNEDVAQLVWAVTGIGKTRKERTRDTIEKISKNISSVDVKIIDRYCNLKSSVDDKKTSLVEMYLKEVKDYESIFDLAFPESKTLFFNQVKRAQKYLIDLKSDIQTNSVKLKIK